MSMQPIKPSDPGGEDYRDHSKGGFDYRSLERLVRDSMEQPSSWRDRADLCHAYYDGKQLTEQQKALAISEGLDPRAINLIRPVTNSVLGYEARTRADIRLDADSDDLADVVDVCSEQMKEAQREAYIDMAIGTAYGGQVKGGIDWVEISRDADPLNYPYRVREVHRNEIHWDMQAKDPLLRDRRWLVRRQWHDLDELEASMPEHRDVLRMMANSWEGWSLNHLIDDHRPQSDLQRAFDSFTRFKVAQWEWLDTIRKRVCLYEVWYKVPARAVAMRINPTRVVLFDAKNPLHRVAVERGFVKLEKVLTRQQRVAIFAGPYRLTDQGTTRRHDPYVPFIAFRDDEDRTPYGLIDGLITPQDEYNERRLRIQWLLKARQITVDNDALDLSKNNYMDLQNNAMRPDLMLILDANRKNANGVTVQSNLTLQKEQYEAMQDSKMLISEVSTVYGPQMGNPNSGVTAGVAIAGLVEQGVVAMGEINDNYRMSRRFVYEHVLQLIIEDHSLPNTKVMTGIGAARREVVLNTATENGMPLNVVSDAAIKVGLSDAPATPAARMQQQTMIAEIIKSLGNNPQGAAVLVPAFLESSALDSETRRQAVEDYRKVAGLPPGGSRQQRAQAEKMVAEQGEKDKQLAEVMKQEQIKEQAAKAALGAAKTELTQAQTAKTLEETRLMAQQQLIDEALNEADEGIAA
ncbi:hypothetical protein UFOVP703_43 [uncultured Caudovirales phage]|uniref:Phage P22-like portal protein n=1 Tax=uncultured Caudovirales phage TaxID=2100421 RepID=A0A6J5NJE8_9CAUD|nr:hypothetical protein UFOVP703_43 [uncultured Caudovirales phage]